MSCVNVKERLPDKEGSYITKFTSGFIGENWFLIFEVNEDPKWYHDEIALGGVEEWFEDDLIKVVHCKDCEFNDDDYRCPFRQAGWGYDPNRYCSSGKYWEIK